MREWKVGDRVRVCRKDDELYGRIGVISKIDNLVWPIWVAYRADAVELDDPDVGVFNSDELEFAFICPPIGWRPSDG